MAYEIPGFSFTLPSDTDLTAKQFYFVNVNATGEAVLAGDGTRAVGVLQNTPNTAEAATVVHSGISKVVAGAAVSQGDSVTSTSGGKAQTAGTGDVVHGIALEAAAADGVVIAVLLTIQPAGISA